jgi:hypothetical protein
VPRQDLSRACARTSRTAACRPRAQPIKYDKTEQQLNALLMVMVEDDKLEYVAGQFKLRPVA